MKENVEKNLLTQFVCILKCILLSVKIQALLTI